MNYTQAMSGIIKAIHHADTSQPGALKIYCRSGTITVGACRPDLKGLVEIGTITHLDICRGLKSGTWNRIENNVRKLIEKGKI